MRLLAPMLLFLPVLPWWPLAQQRASTHASLQSLTALGTVACSYWKKAIPLEELLAVNNEAREAGMDPAGGLR